MLVYGIPESRWGKYFEYGVLVSDHNIIIVKERSSCGNIWEKGDRMIINDFDIVKASGMVE